MKRATCVNKPNIIFSDCVPVEAKYTSPPFFKEDLFSMYRVSYDPLPFSTLFISLIVFSHSNSQQVVLEQWFGVPIVEISQAIELIKRYVRHGLEYPQWKDPRLGILLLLMISV